MSTLASMEEPPTSALWIRNVGMLVDTLPRIAASDRSPIVEHANTGLLCLGGKIVAQGTDSELAGEAALAKAEELDAAGGAVLPGLVDSHTHLAYAGNRIDEFSRRCQGESYQSIAAAGGGIAASVATLEAIAPNNLADRITARALSMAARGVTTIEIKSGYGLSQELEWKQLTAIATARRRFLGTIFPTLLAHTFPKNAQSPDAQTEHIRVFAEALIPQAARQGLAQALDVFIEKGAFSCDQARQLIEAGHKAGLKCKLHVDQLSDDLHGAAFAAEMGALSADHLELSHPDDFARLAAAGTVATILPGCVMFLGKGPWPDGRAMIDAGCDLAIATDHNPGSAHVWDLPLCATLAATQCGLSLAEALWGITRGGGRALGQHDIGHLGVGCQAHVLVLADPDWRALLYSPTQLPIAHTVLAGSFL